MQRLRLLPFTSPPTDEPGNSVGCRSAHWAGLEVLAIKTHDWDEIRAFVLVDDVHGMHP